MASGLVGRVRGLISLKTSSEKIIVAVFGKSQFYYCVSMESLWTGLLSRPGVRQEPICDSPDIARKGRGLQLGAWFQLLVFKFGQKPGPAIVAHEAFVTGPCLPL